MAERIARLLRRSEFLRVAAARRKWAAPGLVLQAYRPPQSDRATVATPPLRVGYTASKKVGDAVHRNRAKRRLRAAVARVMPEHAKPGHDYVVIARAATVARPFDELVRDLEMALQRVGAHRSAERSRGSGEKAPTGAGRRRGGRNAERS